MSLSWPTVVHHSTVIVTSLLLLFSWHHAKAQDVSSIKKDSAAKGAGPGKLDSLLLQRVDSSIKGLPGHAARTILMQIKALPGNLKPALPVLPKLPSDTGRPALKSFMKEKFFERPVLRFAGGYINYLYNFRSNIDTPFLERNIGQHNVTGSLDFIFGNMLPIKINYWVRQSNSKLFRDIADVQVLFDAGGFRNNLNNNLRQRMRTLGRAVQDSVLSLLYQSKLNQLKDAKDWLSLPVTAQKLREYNELMQIPRFGYDMNLPDSTNKQRLDSLRQEAKAFMATYDSAKNEYERVRITVDSLGKKMEDLRNRIQQYGQLVNGKFHDWASYRRWRNELKEYQPELPPGQDKYKWLMGIRSFSVGKSPVNYSELTAKNISLTGVNFEYNTWYYLAISAGVVDYRFRDFVVSRFNHSPQYLYMARLGIGRLESNYFIVSFFRGRKQLFASANNSSHSSAINVTGYSAETKLQLNQTTYVIAEVAGSLSPDYRSSPPVENSKFNWSEKINKALSVKFYSTLPRMASRIEGMYKYTGANFQSFSSFQTNAAIQSWYIKWEQGFFKRKLRITGSLRSNEFSNPYIVQNYKSNTLFKSITAVFKARKWPAVSVGYVPMSQLTSIGGQLLENRFQTFTASVNHFYKIGTKQGITTVVYNRFYNSSSDTGFIYFNSTNFYMAQQFLFRRFSAGFAASHSSSSQYELKVMDGNMHTNINRWFALGIGVKINSFNRFETKPGAYINANIKPGKRDLIYVSYEKGYLPAWQKQLAANTMAMVQYSRTFY